ncbi:MAG: SRPBCC family protein, partial [Bdellovibrionales bacterium]|nr:SRPBCC family protein [Bdellovibrionales bacterium]
LEEITPPFLNFKVETTTSKVVAKGTKITYKLKLHGIPLKWHTTIEDFAANSFFIDNQTKGPYKRWHHTHTFTPLNKGTLLGDRVLYRLPFGWLGRCVAHFYVKKDVQKIFSYRTQTLKKRFHLRQM